MGTQSFPVLKGNEEPKRLSLANHEGVDVASPPKSVGQTTIGGPLRPHLLSAGSPHRGSMVTPLGVSGSGVLRGTYSFDFDRGIEATNWATADVWWEQQTDINRQLVPRNGAALASLGIVDYDSLTYADVVRLPFASTPLTANAQGTNFLVSGATFAVKTRTGKFVKVQVLNYGYNLNLRWQECTPPVRYADVKVTLGSTPEWLVTRYEVSCTYQTSDGPRSCGSGTFDHHGGIVQGQVSNEFGPFPTTITVTVTIDFQPDTGLQGVVRTFTPNVTDTGVNFLFEPYQVMQRTDVLFDLGHTPKPEDYLLLRWKHIANGVPVTSGQRFLSAAELGAQAVTRYEIVFVPDPLDAESLNIAIAGRFQGQSLLPFAQTFELSDQAILLRSEMTQNGQFKLVAT